MSNNLNELNTLLFDTLKKVKENKIDIKQANAITGVANTIVNSAKVQLDMFKMVKEKEIAPIFFNETNILSLTGDTHSKKTQYAKSLGYPNVVSAISDIGSDKFNRNFKKISK